MCMHDVGTRFCATSRMSVFRRRGGVYTRVIAFPAFRLTTDRLPLRLVAASHIPRSSPDRHEGEVVSRLNPFYRFPFSAADHRTPPPPLRHVMPTTPVVYGISLEKSHVATGRLANCCFVEQYTFCQMSRTLMIRAPTMHRSPRAIFIFALLFADYSFINFPFFFLPNENIIVHSYRQQRVIFTRARACWCAVCPCTNARRILYYAARVLFIRILTVLFEFPYRGCVLYVQRLP